MKSGLEKPAATTRRAILGEWDWLIKQILGSKIHGIKKFQKIQKILGENLVALRVAS